MAGAGKKPSDVAAAEATAAAEALEKEAAEAREAPREAEEAAARLKKQQQQDELDVVAVGAVAHVIRRAFFAFYASPEAAYEAAGARDDNAETLVDGEPLQATEHPVEGSKQEEPQQDELQAANGLNQVDIKSPRDIELSPFVALAQARKDAIVSQLEEKHKRARMLLQFMEERQREAAAADARNAEELSQKGLVVKAQIPVGPTHLRLDEEELRAATDAGKNFGEFADSLLHAKMLVEEYEQRRKEVSGNLKRVMPSPSRKTAAGEVSSENGEFVGYLDTTMASSIRKEATLEQHKYHIAVVKVAHAEHREASTARNISPPKDGMNNGGDNVPDLVATALTPLSATQLERQQIKASKQGMNPVEKRKNVAILERMQTKLDFVRNPRYAVPVQSSIVKDRTEEDVTESNVRPKPSFDIVPKPPVAFTNYDIGGIYEQIVYVRNTSSLSRRARILPPATIFFVMASISFPDASGMVAPGMHIQLRVRFTPDSRADYKDSFTVQYETEQLVGPESSGIPGAAGSAEIVVPLMAHREPPELTLPLIIRAQHTLVGGLSVTSLVCKNLGGKARFWLLSEPAWSRLEQLQMSIDGNSPTRSAVDMLGGEYQHEAVMGVGPFRITPNDFELDKGQSVTFDLTYAPSGIGEQRERFVMVCDNCLVRVFQILGRGCQVDIAVTRVNDAPIDTTITEMEPLDRLYFTEEVLVNARAHKTIVLANDTPIDVKFSWKILPLVEEEERDGEGKDKTMVLSLSSTSAPPFRITPDSGVFSSSSSKEFTIEFLPTRAKPYAYQATLMVNDIPACSMPGPGQMAHLKAAFQTHEDTPLNPRAAVKAAARKLRDAMPGFSVQLRGQGRLGSFTIDPPLKNSWDIVNDGVHHTGTRECESAQLLIQNHNYSASVSLRNQVDAPVGYRWDVTGLRQRHLEASGAPLISSITPATKVFQHFDLRISPSMGELSPLGQQQVEITLTPKATGFFSLSVPCRISAQDDANNYRAPRFERWLILEGRVAGAEIKITTREVDFGLVLVGASAESSITIRNPSCNIQMHWKLVHLEGSTSGGGGDPSVGPHLQQSPVGARLRRSSSKESVISRNSVISSSSGNETERSLFTSRDILPRATVAFAPETGVLAPGEIFTVKAICMAGSLPERFRGHFSCQAAPESRFFGANNVGAHAAVSARAEIQCPNVFLSTTRLPLGTTYVGVVIHRTIDLINVSNLESAFKFVEPEGASRAYTITFSPKQGTIHSKERLAVTINYTPRQVGRFTVILACSVRGLPAPLGFELSSNHKGLVLTYDLLQTWAVTKLLTQNERLLGTTSLMLPKSPKEIAFERGIPLTDCDLEPETTPLSNVPKLSFGDNVPLGERRILSLLIRNYSGIEAIVDLEAKKFPAAAVNASLLVAGTTSAGVEKLTRQNSTQFSSSKSRHKNTLVQSKSTRSLGYNRTGPYRTNVVGQETLIKPRLSDAKDIENRFQSDNGRAYLRQRTEDVEDRHILREGRGVAFELHPARVHIPPWEQVVVRVTCFNNMPGTYVDDVVSRATGVPPVFLHANVGVVGTPLALDRNCVGLHFGNPVPTGQPQVLLRQPILTYGDVCIRAPSITRTLRVVNHGPQRARLKWKLVENGREDQLVNVTLRVDFGSRVQLHITSCDENNRDAVTLPFVVEPESAMIPAFSTTPFRVTFDPPKHGISAPRALLLADAYWYDTSQDEKSATDNASAATCSSTILPEGGDPREEDAQSPMQQINNSPLSTTHVAAGKAFTAVRMANAMVRKPGSVTGSIPASSYSPKCVRVLLSADVIEPELSIDKPRQQLQRIQTPPPLSGRSGTRRNSIPPVAISLPQQLAPYHIKFTTWSTLMSTTPAQHHFHQRELFLVNRLGSRVTFRLECDGPFAVAQADSLAPRHPLSMVDLPPAHRRSTAQGESYMFMLPPQMSVRIDLRFLPSATVATDSKPKPKPLLQQHQQPLHSQFDGELRVKFSTKSVQTIRLAAIVLRPAIVVSPSVFFFGRVHLSASRFLVLRLANPTVVPARFAIQHVPRPKPISRAQHQEMRQHHAHLTDEPIVFTFSKLSGELRGPTTSLKSAGGWLPTTDSMRDLLGEDATTTHPLVHAPLELRVEFHPRENGRRYKSRFRFVVEHGRDFEVVLEGTGHLNEVDDPRDGDRPLVHVRELEHSYHIFRGT